MQSMVVWFGPYPNLFIDGPLIGLSSSDHEDHLCFSAMMSLDTTTSFRSFVLLFIGDHDSNIVHGYGSGRGRFMNMCFKCGAQGNKVNKCLRNVNEGRRQEARSHVTQET
jgi:hypothetical protein